jgi:protein O-mannosyl-transferase
MTSRNGLICLALALITLGVYAPVRHFEFVNYDDPDYVTANSNVQSGITKPAVIWAFTTGHASNWHPLTWISHMLDFQLYGLNPAGHHVTNLLFHAANALLLFWVLLRLTGQTWPSAFVAALFAWHPLHVESVAWVSERKDVLSTFFWLLTLLAYTRYVEETGRKNSKARPFYLLALGAFALGLLSKPMVVTLPFVLLLLDYWPLRRIAEFESQPKSKKSENPQIKPVPLARLALEKAPFLLLAIFSAVVTFLAQRKGGAVSSLSTLSLGERIANAFVSYLRYVGKLFWPANLSVLYPHPGKWPVAIVLVAVLFVIGITAFVVIGGLRRKYLLVGWFWFLGTLVPVIGLVQVGVQSMADRYSYIPHIGLFVMLAWGAMEITAKWKERTTPLACAAAATLIACLVITLNQEQYWQDSRRLFQHAVQVTDNNYLAYNNLGYFLDNDAKIDEAMENYKKSIEINPNYDEAQNNMGFVLAKKKRYDEAIRHYEQALRINPNRVEAHNNLGNALADTGHLDEAIQHYQSAMKIRPEDSDAHNNLGIAMAMKGNFEEAVRQITEAIRLKPSNVNAYGNLGNAYAVQHKLDEAVAQYRVVLKSRPEDNQVHNNLANVLSEQGKLDEAIDHYKTALRLKPDNVEAHYNLGLVLLRQGKKEEATSHFAEAVRLKPDYQEAKNQLKDLSTLP